MTSQSSINLKHLAQELGLPPPRSPGGAHRSRPVFDFDVLTATKLSIESTLRGHRGCVNRLAWNPTGDLLASGSDDRTIRIWRYPDSQPPRSLVVPTWHEANIFGVQFMPQSSSSILISGAMDHLVQVHRLDVAPEYHKHRNFGGIASNSSQTATAGTTPPRTPTGLRRGGVIFNQPMNENDDENDDDAIEEERSRQIPVRTTSFACHRGRVKSVIIAPDQPHLFWSCSEDGTVRQFDLRLPASDMDKYTSSNVLIGLSTPSRHLELKSVALNPARPDQVAVGAGDAFVRIFDRRKLSLTQPNTPSSRSITNGDKAAVMKLAPPHMSVTPAAMTAPRVHTTHVEFGRRGDKVLAAYHGDHTYAWDVLGSEDRSSSSNVAMEMNYSQQQQQQTADEDRINKRKLVQDAGIDLLGGWCPSSQGSDSGLKRQNIPFFSDTISTSTTIGEEDSSSLEMPLPRQAEVLKNDGNLAYFEGSYAVAVELYSEALRIAPYSAALYHNRALALLNKNWEGDCMAALRDCEISIDLRPGYQKVLLRRAHALRACKLFKSAEVAAKLYQDAFPENSDEVSALLRLLESDIVQQTQQEERQRQQRESRRAARRRRGFSRPRRRRANGGGGSGDMQVAAVDTDTTTTTEQQQQEQREEPQVGVEQAAVQTQQYAHVEELGGDNHPGAASGHITIEVTEEESIEDEELLPQQQQQQSSGGGGSPMLTSPSSDLSPATTTTSDAAGAISNTTRSTSQDRQQQEAEQPPPTALEAAAFDNTSSSDDENDEGLFYGSRGEEAHALTMAVDELYAEALLASYSANYTTTEAEAPSKSDPQLSTHDDTNKNNNNGFIGPTLPIPPRNRAALFDPSTVNLALLPRVWSSVPGGRRMLKRYIGACNLQTDIKEATFLGSNDQLVASGSDDGRVFIHDAVTGKCVRILLADEDVVNCVRPHPTLPVLATSGIENVVRVWSPEGNVTKGSDIAEVVASNQDRIKAGPQAIRGLDARLFAALSEHPELLQALTLRRRADGGEDESGGEEEGEDGGQVVRCRVT